MNWTEITVDAMVLISCVIMTLGVLGIVRMPDIYTKLHGASKSLFLGVVLICIAASVQATDTMNMRLVLIGILVVITTPLSSHVIGRTAYLMHERMETPGALDESQTLLEESADPENEGPGWRL
jgi:multicomponent Na+:H+ antiporter subunit G